MILHYEALAVHPLTLSSQCDDYGRQARQSLAAGVRLTTMDISHAHHHGKRFTAAVDRILSVHDVIITPTTLTPAPPLSAFPSGETTWTPM